MVTEASQQQRIGAAYFDLLLVTYSRWSSLALDAVGETLREVRLTPPSPMEDSIQNEG